MAKRWPVEAAVGAIAAGAVLMALMLGATTAAAESSRAPSSTDPSLDPHFVSIQAQLPWQQRVLPVSGAKVRVMGRNGRVVGRGKTGIFGAALVNVRRIPRHPRIKLGGGWAGSQPLERVHLATWLRHYHAPRVIYVDPLTTVVARTAKLRPHWGYRKVLRNVRHDLVVPRFHHPGKDVLAPTTFDGMRLWQIAGGPGGVDRKLDRLARRAAHPGGKRTERFKAGARSRRAARLTSRAPRVRAADSSSSSAEQWNSAAGTFADGVDYGLEGLTKVWPSLEWLAPIAGEASIVYGISEIIEAFTGLSSPEASIGDVMNSLGEVQQEVAALQESFNTLTGLVETNATSEEFENIQGLSNDISTAYNLLVEIGNETADLTCGETPSNPPTAATCADPEPISTVCDSSTQLTWQDDHVVKPQGWTSTPADPTQEACKTLSKLIYGNAGFVATVTGNSAMDGSPANSLGFSDLGTINSDALGGEGAEGLIQVTSQSAAAAADPFFTQGMSDGVQLMGGYLLSNYANLSLVLIANAGYTNVARSNIQALLNAQPTFASMQEGMPHALPGGTVIDTMTNLMWNTGIGALASSNGYYSIAGQAGSNVGGSSGVGGEVTLTASGVQNPPNGVQQNATSSSATPIDPRSVTADNPAGSPFGDWWAADGATLNTLYDDACGGCSSPAQTVEQAGGFQSQLLYPNGSGTRVYDPQIYDWYWGPFGASTTYDNSGDGLPSMPVPLALVSSCTAPCTSAGFSAGSQFGVFDFNAGGDYTTDQSLPDGATFGYLDNWNDGAWQSCTTHWVNPFSDSGCPDDDNRFWPEIWGSLSDEGLPAIFQRPTTPGECYYWPASPANTPGPSPGDHQPASGINGCGANGS